MRVYGDSMDCWCPESLREADEDGSYRTVRDEILAAVEVVALTTHRAEYRERCADRF